MDEEGRNTGQEGGIEEWQTRDNLLICMKFNYHFNEHEMLFGISTNNDDDGSRHV